MENNKIRKLRDKGYSFHGAWISNYATPEELKNFKERRKDLKSQGLDVATAKDKDGTGLYVKRKEE